MSEAVSRPSFGKRQILTLGLCTFATFFEGFDIQSLGLAVPAIADAMDVPATAFAPALSGFVVGMAAGSLLLCPLADQHGRKLVLSLVLLLIGATMAGTMTAQSPGVLAIWRILAGFGMGALPPMALTLAAENAPEGKGGVTISLILAATSLGIFGAGFLAPSLEHHFGWRGIFGFGTIMTLVASFLLFLDSRDEVPQKKASSRHSTSHAKAYKALFENAYRWRTILLSIILFINMFATFAMISWLPTLLESAGWPRADAQRAAGFMALGSIVGAFLIALIVDKGRGVPALAAAYLITSIAFVVLGTAPESRVESVVLILIVGGGLIGSQIAIGALAATFYPPEIRATAIGFGNAMGRTGAILGPLAFAATMMAEMPAEQIIGSLSIPMLICTVTTLLLLLTYPKATAVSEQPVD